MRRAIRARPRVRSLRSEVGEEAAELFGEFEKILDGAEIRLNEALQETEALLEQTRRQFHGLLLAHRDDGLVARFLVENAGYVVLVFEGGVDRLFEALHGEAATGYAVAARSYLDSGHFGEGARLLSEARSRVGDREAWVRLSNYAEAMVAYLAGEYADAVKSLTAWLEQSPPADESAYASLALDAVSHLGRLTEGEEGSRVAAAAEELTERLQSVAAATA